MDGKGGRGGAEDTAPESTIVPDAPTGDVARTGRRIVVVVRPGASRRRAAEVLRWVRWLVPAAVLLITPAPLPPGDADPAVSIDVDEVASGPLSLADALLRDRGERP